LGTVRLVLDMVQQPLNSALKALNKLKTQLSALNVRLRCMAHKALNTALKVRNRLIFQDKLHNRLAWALALKALVTVRLRLG
jgi:hypothetical protein